MGWLVDVVYVRVLTDEYNKWEESAKFPLPAPLFNKSAHFRGFDYM